MENSYSRHMPDFRVMSNFPNSTIMEEDALLSLVVVLGSSISLVGLIFAFITYSLFSDLRNMSGTMVMNLLATLFMSQLMYVIGVGGTQDSNLCVSLGFAIQLFHLAEFCWLLALIYNMYDTFRNNLNMVQSIPSVKISPVFLKYSLFGWGLPITIVLFAYLLNLRLNPPHQNYQTFGGIGYKNCWFLDVNVYIISYAIPVTILLLLTIYKMYKCWIIIKYSVALQVDLKVKEKMRKTRLLQYFLYVKVITLLGGTFIFAVVSRLSNSNVAWIGFNIQHSLQGLFVSVVVACNCQILKIYAKSIRKKRRRGENLIDFGQLRHRSSDISRSTSLNSLSWKPEVISV